MYVFYNSRDSLPASCHPVADAQVAVHPDTAGNLSGDSHCSPVSLVFRRAAGSWTGLVAVGILAAFYGQVAQAATPLGTTQAQINAKWPVAFHLNLRNLHNKGGDAAVDKFFMQLSAVQLYDLETIWNATAAAHGLPKTLFALAYDGTVISTPAGRAWLIKRIAGVNLKFNSMAAIPGGRRAIQKLPEPPSVGGFPATWTVMEVYTYYASILGYDVGQAIWLTGRVLLPEASVVFAGTYSAGTYMSGWIQTYDPALQEAMGYDLNAAVNATIASVQLTVDAAAMLTMQINLTVAAASPGINDADFDGVQLGAVTTAEMMPD